jgi:hypothetical protein
MTAGATTSRDTLRSLAGKKTCATAMSLEPENAAVTTAGGICGLAVQQFVLVGAHGMLMCEQQRCAACCAGSTHVPTENSNTPIRAMATAVRWMAPCNMVSAYHIHKLSPCLASQ